MGKIIFIVLMMVFLSGFGICQDAEKPGFFALYAWYGEFLKYPDDVANIGIKWIRVAGGGPDAKSDKCLLEAAKKGIHCVPSVDDKEIAKKNDMGKWREIVRKVVTRYGPNGTLWKENPSVPALPVEYIEIWNEPNIGFLDPPKGMRRDECYYFLLKNAYEEIKSINKDIKVIAFNTSGGILIKKDWGPPFDGVDDNKHMGWFKFIKDVHKRGGGKYYDILGVHPYPLPDTPENKMAESIEAIRKEMKENGGGEKPIWFTEVGFGLPPTKPSIKDEDEQADYLLRLFGIGISHGIVQIQVMYIVDIEFSWGKRCFGFFNGKKWRKQAAATKVMIGLVGDSPELVKIISDGENDFYAYEFKGKEKNVIMTWTSNDKPEEKEIKVSGNTVSKIDKMGNKEVMSVSNGVVRIKITGSPIYIQ